MSDPSAPPTAAELKDKSIYFTDANRNGVFLRDFRWTLRGNAALTAFVAEPADSSGKTFLLRCTSVNNNVTTAYCKLNAEKNTFLNYGDKNSADIAKFEFKRTALGLELFFNGTRPGAFDDYYDVSIGKWSFGRSPIPILVHLDPFAIWEPAVGAYPSKAAAGGAAAGATAGGTEAPTGGAAAGSTSGATTTPAAGGSGTTPATAGSGTTPATGGATTTPAAGGSGTTPATGGAATTPAAAGGAAAGAAGAAAGGAAGAAAGSTTGAPSSTSKDTPDAKPAQTTTVNIYPPGYTGKDTGAAADKPQVITTDGTTGAITVVYGPEHAAGAAGEADKPKVVKEQGGAITVVYGPTCNHAGSAAGAATGTATTGAAAPEAAKPSMEDELGITPGGMMDKPRFAQDTYGGGQPDVPAQSSTSGATVTGGATPAGGAPPAKKTDDDDDDLGITPGGMLDRRRRDEDE